MSIAPIPPAVPPLWPVESAPTAGALDHERAVALLPVFEALLAASTVDQAIAALIRDGAAALGARQGRVLLVADDSGTELEVAGAMGLPSELAERRIGPDIHAPAHDAVRHRMIAGATSPEEWVGRYGSLAAVLSSANVGACVAVPLACEERLLGALELCLPVPRALTPIEHERLATIARYGALALDRLRRGEHERELRAQAERANQVKADFLAVVSHELRTPLNAIGGYTELLQMGLRGPLTPSQEEDLRRIEQSQRHLLSLVNAILDFAKLDAGRVSFVLTDVRAAEVLEDIEPLVQPQARSKGIRLIRDLCDPDLKVVADREKVQQVLLNLLTNAIKFTPPGGTVTIRCTAARRLASFHVIDTGVGIPANKIERIFEPFVQVNRSLSTPADGVGLGLAISRELARGMRGFLRVTSTLGEGSAFTLVLPRTPTDGS